MLDHKLIVKRKLSNGNAVKVGELAENRNGIYFQYNDQYLNNYSNISPFAIEESLEAQLAPQIPHKKLHGVFSDSLPDGWGLHLMDKIFRKNDYDPKKITQLERLAFIGDNCLGALYYEPTIEFATERYQGYSIRELGKQAVNEFEGTETELIESLMNTAGSGGARPKINATLLSDGSYTTNRYVKGKPSIIKLTSEKFDLAHEESLVEYCCMTLANQCGIETSGFDLLEAEPNRFWLRQDRFDCIGDNGRLHMISASGLLDASFSEPSLDYVDLIKATRMMCGVTEAKKMISRALFNYLICNQDDHAKNFAFLCDDDNNWRLSPFYDVVYSPSPYKEHMTSFAGEGENLSTRSLDLMSRQAGINPKEIKPMAQKLMDNMSNINELLNNSGVSSSSSKTISKTVEQKLMFLDKQI
ncbi:type II toxin-antitoxin system HipA family toxin [Colwellia hornerae]|uniref:Type II toxin-antitoxin system HipA family toxin n=1 Tax=Colwellia hornerae TaxID=89402 RepID=A0A5C6Q8L1_9GAMM|nr:type II toxin-antitoxin system HipA family toxin [Colwellia hornerae]TWX50229.1 type II toxin-antitoxin system HipA family toxin [Colwellia hornerae]TWX56126.1 type II toxin-antitoxin system HipA family toxin [Colwellia hornerae]TWX65148.1 type II toxin-antitoxin system HipA family toxin [Colwellia hornerae]